MRFVFQHGGHDVRPAVVVEVGDRDLVRPQARGHVHARPERAVADAQRTADRVGVLVRGHQVTDAVAVEVAERDPLRRRPGRDRGRGLEGRVAVAAQDAGDIRARCADDEVERAIAVHAARDDRVRLEARGVVDRCRPQPGWWWRRGDREAPGLVGHQRVGGEIGNATGSAADGGGVGDPGLEVRRRVEGRGPRGGVVGDGGGERRARAVADEGEGAGRDRGGCHRLAERGGDVGGDGDARRAAGRNRAGDGRAGRVATAGTAQKARAGPVAVVVADAVVAGTAHQPQGATGAHVQADRHRGAGCVELR